MSDDIVSRARELMAAATPGPWFLSRRRRERVCCGDPAANAHEIADAARSPSCGDAALIAAAPGLLAALADEVERLRADNARLRGLVTRVANAMTEDELFATVDDCRDARGNDALARQRLGELEIERGNLCAKLRAAEAVLGTVDTWTHVYGAALKPTGADTFGEGVRACKEQVSRLLSRAALDSAREPEAGGTEEPGAHAATVAMALTTNKATK
jgi:hypothetical protein